jgi:hypothetical protein
LSYPHPFDYAAIHNFCVPKARGEFLCLLNNDTEVVTPGWLREMLGQAQRAGVGAVGAKLLYPDDTIQHGGVLLGLGIAEHAHKHVPGHSGGYCGRGALVQNFSAVTAACLLMRKVYWDDVGGMAPELPVAYNDVDLCLRLQEKGLRNVWVPQAILYHHESKSRGIDSDAKSLHRSALEHAYMQWRWGFLLRNDPAYNPNLSLDRGEDFSWAHPPRVRRPWRQDVFVVDVPYGHPHDKHKKSVVLPPDDELSGSFLVPVGVQGEMKGLALLIGTYDGRADGVLVVQLEDTEGRRTEARAPLKGARDSAMLPVIFGHQALHLCGQEKLFFRIHTERATHPVAFWVFRLNKRWGHQIAGHEEWALRMELQVAEEARI